VSASGTTLVTGGTGFAGSHLIDRLAGHGRVIAWHRSSRPPSSEVPSIEWQQVDLLDADGVANAIATTKPSRIYHVAGAPHLDAAWRDVLPHLRTNVLGTHYVLEGVRRLTAPCRLLVVSSAMIYAASDEPIDEHSPLAPASPYGVSKLAQDQLALRAHEEDGVDVVVARPFNHAGPRQDPGFVLSSFARQIALIEAGEAAPELRVGNLDARRDFTDVRDVVAAYERIMDAGAAGRAYNICSGQASRVGDLLAALLSRARTRITIAFDQARLRPSDTPIVVGNPGRIRGELGWAPARTIDQVVDDTLEWWRNNLGSYFGV